MRYIDLDQLVPGMELGRTIYGSNGQVLLKKGVLLRDGLISSIRKQNCSGIYVDDDFSSEIEVRDVIDESLRNETVQKLKSFFVTLQADTEPKSLYSDLKKLNQLIEGVVDQIFLNKSMVVNLIDLKNHDDYTFQHSVNVSVLATVLGVALNYPRRSLMNLARGALFHDIGKMFVDKGILNKQGKLTNDEFDDMKKHAEFGYEYAKKHLSLTDEALIGILQHHEKYNGQGYPHAKSKNSIHKNSQVIAISDVFDAMTAKRVYHEAILPSEAIEYIMGNMDQHFDPKIVEVFLRKIPAYPLGISVELSDGNCGLVCENYEGFTMRPKVKLFTEGSQFGTYLDLREKEHSALTIVGVRR